MYMYMFISLLCLPLLATGSSHVGVPIVPKDTAGRAGGAIGFRVHPTNKYSG